MKVDVAALIEKLTVVLRQPVLLTIEIEFNKTWLEKKKKLKE